MQQAQELRPAGGCLSSSILAQLANTAAALSVVCDIQVDDALA
jgi:hypothetical protein